MGAYENPAMITDNSGQILAQGLKEMAAGIAKGVETRDKKLNDQLERRRKEIEKRNTAAANAEIQAGEAAMKFQEEVNAFKIKNPTSLTEEGFKVYNKKAEGLGDVYYNAAKVYYNPNSNSESRKTALEQMNDTKKQVTVLQGQISNTQLSTKIATEYVNDGKKTIYLPTSNLTIEQSGFMVKAMATELNSGYLDDSTKFEAEYDDNNNLVYTFKDIESGDVLFSETLNSNSENSVDRYAVKGYDGKKTIQEYQKEQGIVGDNQQFTEQFRGKTKVEIKDDVQVVSTTYDAIKLDNRNKLLYDQIYTELTTTDAKSPEVAARRLKGFLLQNGLTEDDIQDFMGDKVSPGVITQEEIQRTIKQYVLNSATPGYRVDNNGNYYTTKETVYKQGQEGGKLTKDEKALQALQQGWGQFDVYSFGNGRFELEKVAATNGESAHYVLYQYSMKDGMRTADRVGGGTKYYISDTDNSKAIYQAATALGFSVLPTF